MKTITGRKVNGGTLYARQKGDPAPRKGNYTSNASKGSQRANTGKASGKK